MYAVGFAPGWRSGDLGVGYIFATAVAVLAASAPAGREDHIPNFNLVTMRSMSTASGHCLKATRIARPSGDASAKVWRRARCSAVYIVFGGPSRYGDVTIFFPAPDHAAARAIAVTGAMKNAQTLEIQALYWGRRAPRPATGTCVARSAKGFNPPPVPSRGDRYAQPSLEEVAAQMDDVGTPQVPLDMICHVTDPGTGRTMADIAFRQHRPMRRRH
ncbi:MAG: hypothetical protein V4475_01235 [Pseudomonadota bacterium]